MKTVETAVSSPTQHSCILLNIQQTALLHASKSVNLSKLHSTFGPRAVTSKGAFFWDYSHSGLGITESDTERTHIQLFRERLSEKAHATIPKGIVGSFKFTVP